MEALILLNYNLKFHVKTVLFGWDSDLRVETHHHEVSRKNGQNPLSRLFQFTVTISGKGHCRYGDLIMIIMTFIFTW